MRYARATRPRWWRFNNVVCIDCPLLNWHKTEGGLRRLWPSDADNFPFDKLEALRNPWQPRKQNFNLPSLKLFWILLVCFAKQVCCFAPRSLLVPLHWQPAVYNPSHCVRLWAPFVEIRPVQVVGIPECNNVFLVKSFSFKTMTKSFVQIYLSVSSSSLVHLPWLPIHVWTAAAGA